MTTVKRHVVEAIGNASAPGGAYARVARHVVEAIGNAPEPGGARARVVRHVVDAIGSAAARATALNITPAAHVQSHTLALAVALAPGSFLALHPASGNVYAGLQIRPVDASTAQIVYTEPETGYRVRTAPLPAYEPMYLLWMLDTSAGTARLRVNGIDVPLISEGADVPPTGTIYAQIGGFADPHAHSGLGAVDAHLADLICYHGILSHDEMRIIEIYLGVKISQAAPERTDMEIDNFMLLRPHYINPVNLIATNVPIESMPAWPDLSIDNSLPDLPLMWNQHNPEITRVAKLGAQTIWRDGIWECIAPGYYDNDSTPHAPRHTYPNPYPPESVAAFARIQSVNAWSALNVDRTKGSKSGSGLITYTLSFAQGFTGVALVRMVGVETATITVSSELGSRTLSRAYPSSVTSPWFVHDLLMSDVGGLAQAGGIIEITITGGPDLEIGAIAVGWLNIYGRYLHAPTERSIDVPEQKSKMGERGQIEYVSQFVSRNTTFTVQLDRHSIDNLERTMQDAALRPMVYAIASVDIPIIRYAALRRMSISERNVLPKATVEISSLM
jgi:hypothetical protein